MPATKSNEKLPSHEELPERDGPAPLTIETSRNAETERPTDIEILKIKHGQSHEIMALKAPI